MMRAALAQACAALLLAACQAAPPPSPAERPAPRHPIQPYAAPVQVEPASSSGEEPRRLTPGPNSRVSPSPDMAPRVEPTQRETPSSRQDIEDLSRRLQEQRRWEPARPGPPVGTIDQRPGTIRTTPGTIEVPR